MKNKLWLVLLFLVLVPTAQAQIEFTVQALSDVPNVIVLNYIRVTDKNIWADSVLNTGKRNPVMKGAADSSWLVPRGTLRSGLLPKTLDGGTIVQGSSVVMGSANYFNAVQAFKGPNGGPLYGTISQKMENGIISQICDGSSFYIPVTSGVELNTFRGAVPNPDGKLYFSGRRTAGKSTTGIYSLNKGGTNGDCEFSELFLTDPNFEILNIGKETSGSFIAERFPVGPKNLETEIVRYSPTGEMTILFSSNAASKPQTLVAAGCCSLVYDPTSQSFVVKYKSMDGKNHFSTIANGKTAELTAPDLSASWAQLEPLSLKGDWLLAIGAKTMANFDSFVLVHIPSSQSAIVYGPDKVPAGATAQAINAFRGDISDNGNVTFVLGTKAYQANVKVTVPVVPVTPAPKLPKITKSGFVIAAGSKPGIAVGALQTVYGANLSGMPNKTKFALNSSATIPTTLGGTQVLLNGKPLPVSFVSDSQVNFLMPLDIEPGTLAQIQVTAKDTTGVTLTSDKVELTVLKSLPCFFMAAGLVIAQNPFTGEVATAEKPLQRYAANGKIYATFYLTGLGLKTETADGLQPLPADVIARTILTVNGVSVNDGITYIGGTPGFDGLYQLNVAIDDAGSDLELNLLFDGSINPVMQNNFHLYVSSL